jgi:hypothetical protein
MDTLPMLIIPLVVFLSPVLVTILVLRYRQVRAEHRYQFLLKLAESGTPLPTQLPGEATPQQCDRRRALVLLTGGLGLSLMLLALPFDYHLGRPVAELWGLGILPIALGLGYLANWFLNRPGSLRE